MLSSLLSRSRCSTFVQATKQTSTISSSITISQPLGKGVRSAATATSASASSRLVSDLTRRSESTSRQYVSNGKSHISGSFRTNTTQQKNVRSVRSTIGRPRPKRVLSRQHIHSNTSRVSLQPTGYLIPVEAIHIAEKIDMIQLFANVSFGHQRTTNRKKMFGNKHLSYGVFQLDGSTETAHHVRIPSADIPIKSIDSHTRKQTDHDNLSVLTKNDVDLNAQRGPTQRFVAVFPFGSVVFFNVPSNEVPILATQIKKFASEPVLSGSERKEKYNVFIQEDIGIVDDAVDNPLVDQSVESVDGSHTASIGVETRDVTPDYCIVHDQLDMNGVAVISNIMAQTVALDTYSDTVDELLAKFASINSTVKRTGKFTPTDRNFLFKTVAQNNSIFIDMISKTRIKDRSDTAWTLTKYEAIHYGLKNEFEIDDRFENIEFKLNLIQQNAKFFMEVLHHKSSNELEVVIVVLILAECILMMIEMSGNGGRLFHYLSSILPSLELAAPEGAAPDVADIQSTIVTASRSCSGSGHH